MSYRQLLDEAIGDSPPSMVDIDRLIRRERRARSRRRRGVCGAAAAVLAVTGAVALLAPGAPPTVGPAVPTITTTPGTPEDEARIDRAVVAAVAHEAPTVTWVRALGEPNPDIPTPRPSGEDELDTRVSYERSGVIDVGGVTAELRVQVIREGTPVFGVVSCSTRKLAPNTVCENGSGPNGERLQTYESQIRQEGHGGKNYAQNDRLLRALRPDGQLASVSLTTMRQDGRFPLTVAQQTAVVLDRAFALAPLPSGMVVPSPSPRPTPTRSAQQLRIDNAVYAALRRQAPTVKGAGGADATRTDLASVWSDSGGENTADAYWGQGRIVVGGATGLFSVQISRTDPGFSGDMTCAKQTKVYRCTAGVGPHGERYRTVTNTNPGGSAERMVDVRRKNGSWLSVTLAGDPPKATFPLTEAQQQAIAFDQAIALAAVK